MKKWIVGAAFLTLLASCQKEREFEPSSSRRFHITVEASPETKTSLGTYDSQANTVLWGTGEQMELAVTAAGTSVFAASAVTDSYNGLPSATFSFTVEGMPSAASYLYQGIYPASAVVAEDNINPSAFKVRLPSVQNASAGTYDPSAFIMIARPTEFNTQADVWTASFRRAVALNHLILQGLDDDDPIRRVEIIAPAGVSLSGTREMNLSTGESGPIPSGSRSIDVKYAPGLNQSGGNLDVWFTSWGAEMTAGDQLTITVYTGDYYYTKNITIPSGYSITFEEGKLNTVRVDFSVYDDEGEFLFSGGKGTAASPYRIEKAADLTVLASCVATSEVFASACYRQTADIDFEHGTMNAIGNTNDESSPSYFKGTYEGNGFWVRNVNITNPNSNKAYGFFGYLDGEAHVDGVRLENVSVSAGTWNVGAVVGCIQPSSTAVVVENCVVKGVSLVSSRYNVGGIVGRQMGGTVRNCHFSGTVMSQANSADDHGNVGGIVGDLYKGDILSCYVTGTETVIQTAKDNAGGIVGLIEANGNVHHIDGCRVNCQLVSVMTGSAGGVVGKWDHSPGYVNACTARCNATSKGVSGAYGYVGGIVGQMWCDGTYEMLVANCCFTGGELTMEDGTAGGVGGIVGRIRQKTMDLTTVFNCCAFPTRLSTKVGDKNLAGIVGIVWDTRVRNCYSPVPASAVLFDGSPTTASSGSIYGWMRGSNVQENGTQGGIMEDVYWLNGFRVGSSSGNYTYVKNEQKLTDAQMRGTGSVTRPSTGGSYSDFPAALNASADEWNENPLMDVYAQRWVTFSNGYPVPACTADASASGSSPEPVSGPHLLNLLEAKIAEYGGAEVAANHVFVCAHRANTYWSKTNSYPENSIPAIEKAAALGVDMVELDVRHTSDGKLVLLHDPTVNAVTNGTGNVEEMTLAQVKALRMRARGTSTYKKVDGDYIRIPTLEEALLACKGKVFVNLDLNGRLDNDWIDDVVEVIRITGMRDQVCVYPGGSGDKKAYAREGFARLGGRLAIHMWLDNPDNAVNYVSGYFGTLKFFQFDYWSTTVTGYGKRCHANNVMCLSNCLNSDSNGDLDDQVVAWYTSGHNPSTACEPLDKFIQSGADFIQTDNFEIVDEYMSNKGLR